MTWYERNKTRAKLTGDHWRSANPGKITAKNKRYRVKHAKHIKELRAKYNKDNRHRIRQKQRQYQRTLREQVLKYYGRICACCGEDKTEFLGIDHENGGGKQHRKDIWNHIYRWLKSNDYPSGFRILCHNCNMALNFYGFCPHRDTAINGFVRCENVQKEKMNNPGGSAEGRAGKKITGPVAQVITDGFVHLKDDSVDGPMGIESRTPGKSSRSPG